MLLDLLISTLAFILVGFLLRRFFDAQNIPHGKTRALLILVLATAASFAASALLSWMIGAPSTEQQLLQGAQQVLSGGNPPH